jgi:hypothetical protein
MSETCRVISYHIKVYTQVGKWADGGLFSLCIVLVCRRSVVNSWGGEWGHKGTFRIARGQNECGIEDSIVAGAVAETQA